MSESSFLLSVCPKYVGNVAKTLREVGTYVLVQGTVTGDGAHAVGLLGRGVFLPVLLWSNIAIELDYRLPRRCAGKRSVL